MWTREKAGAKIVGKSAKKVALATQKRVSNPKTTQSRKRRKHRK